MKDTYSTLVISSMLIPLFLISFFSATCAIMYTDRLDYDEYGILMASTPSFVALGSNDITRFGIFMAPFGHLYFCSYPFTTPNYFVMNVAVGRRQNPSQTYFVYFATTTVTGTIQQLGIFNFSTVNVPGSPPTISCNQNLNPNEGAHVVQTWNRPPSDLTTLQVDLYGKYAYGFLSNYIFIYDIERNNVTDLSWNATFPSITFAPHALDISETSDGTSMAVIAGYYQTFPGQALPIVYLVRLNPPDNMVLVDNYSLSFNVQQFVRGQYAFTYQYDYVMSVSIHDALQQVIVAVPLLNSIFRFSFTSTKLTLMNILSYPARSTVWLDDTGTQVALLLGTVTTLPWAQSQVQVIDTTSNSTIYACPNNQQTLSPWSTTTPSFLRLGVTYKNQYVILTTDGTVVLVPSVNAGYYMVIDDINNDRNKPQPCPSGTYKSTPGAAPCIVCPSMTKSFNDTLFNSTNSTDAGYPTTACTPCSPGSYCPLSSVTELDQSSFQPISQAYAYPNSPSTTSFDDILMQNTFNLQTQPARCLAISPFFWAILTLIVAFIVLLIMGLLYYTPSGVKYFHHLELVLRHSDLIGNGELWFGGLVSFAVIVLIVYGYWFGFVFLAKYPIETATDADFACDPSLRNAQFSSSLQLLTTIKSNAQQPMFDMLDNQTYILTVTFIQTGYGCHDLDTQQNIGTYAVSLPIANCTEQPENATLIATYILPQHEMTLQINLTGSYYIGGLLFCLSGPNSNSSANGTSYTVQEMNFCQLFGTMQQTIAQTTTFNFGMTKVINQTDALDYSGSSDYSGIWIPTVTYGSLDDHIMYSQRGDYLRYLATKHIVIITFAETDFYINNEEQPIARRGEIIFHNILFTTTILGIFTLAFLVFKLTFMPLLLLLLKRPKLFCCHPRAPEESDTMEEPMVMHEVAVIDANKSIEDLNKL